MKYSEIIAEKYSNVLKCPVCGAEMSPSENKKSLLCNGTKRHCFDVSAKGHVNLALNHSGGGDSKEAVRSRSAFLNKDFSVPAFVVINWPKIISYIKFTDVMSFPFIVSLYTSEIIKFSLLTSPAIYSE